MSYTSSRKWESEETRQKNQARHDLKTSRRTARRLGPANPTHLARLERAEESVTYENDIRTAKEAYYNRKHSSQQLIDQNGWGLTYPALTFKGKPPRDEIVMPVPDMATRRVDRRGVFYPWPLSCFGSFTMYQRSPVLAEPTIWLPSNHPEKLLVNKRTISSECGIWDHEMLPGKNYHLDDKIDQSLGAGWPCAQELKFEGEDRIASLVSHRRCLPVPRKPGNATVNWQQLQYLEQHPFDQVFSGSNRLKPSIEDVHFMEFEVGFDGQPDTEVAQHLLGSSLSEELDPLGVYHNRQDW